VPVRVGVLLVPATLGDSPLDPAHLSDLAVVAEQVGLDRVGLSDHLLHPSPCWDPIACLGALCVATQRVRLASQVLILPLRHPLHVAQAFTTLDALSKGRIELGVGLGGEFPVEYEALGLAVHRRGRLADEALAALLSLWDDDVGDGDHGATHLGSLRLPVRPVQVPHPPIVVGGRSPAAVTRAARFGDRWDGIFLDANQYRKRAELLGLAAEAQGRRVGSGLVAWVRVGPEGEARAELARSLELFYGTPFEHIERFCLFGGLEHCAERAAELVEAGAADLTLIPAGRGKPAEQVLAVGELAARLRSRVAPRMGALASSAGVAAGGRSSIPSS
jgi:alkanesulfonate monooxygenase SsuD/methylene tetrahydromethanopterin reductase-like flavin-dependent oxidoreductase (luciferase family)